MAESGGQAWTTVIITTASANRMVSGFLECFQAELRMFLPARFSGKLSSSNVSDRPSPFSSASRAAEFIREERVDGYFSMNSVCDVSWIMVQELH